MILNIRGNLIEFNRPAVMGIVNVTPDSFFAGSRVPADSVTARVSEMMAQGADIIDLGGYSSRPGADTVTAEEELARLVPAIAAIGEISRHSGLCRHFPGRCGTRMHRTGRGHHQRYRRGRS